MSYLARVTDALETIEAGDRWRAIGAATAPAGWLDLGSNDYLALAQHPDVVAALHGARRVGAGGARLLSGAFPEHAELERALAALTGREAALLFSSGYLAAQGAAAALAPLFAHVYSDRLNHACLIDGIRLARTPFTVYPHAAPPARADRVAPALIVSESLFGMDADALDVAALVAQLGPDDALLLDEAHALGLCGARGGGLAAAIDDPRVIVIGTLSKAFGALGGFVAGPRALVAYLQNAARTFLFDTSLPPAVAAAARCAVTLAAADDAGRARVHQLAGRLRTDLRGLGYDARGDAGAAIPIVTGSEAAALELTATLRAHHIVAPAIRPPTVPAGAARVRLTVRADHTAADGERLLAVLGEL